MSQEITISASLNVTKNSTSLISGNFARQIDLNGDETLQGSLIAGISNYVDIPLSTLESVGMLLIKNNDATNFVRIAHYNGSAEQEILKLRPGTFALFQPKWGSNHAIRAKADTAACEIFFAATEE